MSKETTKQIRAEISAQKKADTNNSEPVITRVIQKRTTSGGTLDTNIAKLMLNNGINGISEIEAYAASHNGAIPTEKEALKPTRTKIRDCLKYFAKSGMCAFRIGSDTNNDSKILENLGMQSQSIYGVALPSQVEALQKAYAGLMTAFFNSNTKEYYGRVFESIGTILSKTRPIQDDEVNSLLEKFGIASK